ncbi:MAG: metallophosphoesterase [Gammaproteobacteria bacterium]|nr:metallophosphoesterase [Gammaproteobacteria bacterium]
MRLLHFTDLHLHDDPSTVWRGVRPQQTFEISLYHARSRHWPADLLLLTGDIANEEFDDTYSRLAAAAAGWQVDIIAVPGNHDNRAAMESAFIGSSIRLGGVYTSGKWTVITLDSQVPGAVHGCITAGQRDWLLAQLAEHAGQHVLVTLHHPPLTVGSRWLDDLRLEDDESFRALLGEHGVNACLFGHAHQAYDHLLDGVHYLGTPATCVQFRPNSDEFAEDTRPPAYRWLELEDDGSLLTGVEWLHGHGKEKVEA